MRLIDADSLKKRFEECRYLFSAHGLYPQNLVDYEPTVGGWISVNERLPENGQFVVVRHEVKGRIYSEVAHYIMDLWWLDWDSNGLELNAISWIPLPDDESEVNGDG